VRSRRGVGAREDALAPARELREVVAVGARLGFQREHDAPARAPRRERELARRRGERARAGVGIARGERARVPAGVRADREVAIRVVPARELERQSATRAVYAARAGSLQRGSNTAAFRPARPNPP
jgi:hypothetical protein